MTGKWLLPSKETTVEKKQDVNFNVRGLCSCQCSLLHIAVEPGDDAQRPDKGEVVVWLPSTWAEGLLEWEAGAGGSCLAASIHLMK